MKPKVDLIVLNWNEKEMLERCIDHIRQNTNYSNYNIVVVDNGSEDGSKEFIEDLDVDRIMNEDNRGFAIANNQALYNSDADYCCLMNNDVFMEENWLSFLVDCIESEDKYGIAGGKLKFSDGRIQNAGSEVRTGHVNDLGNKEEDKGQHDSLRTCDYVIGALFLIDREVIERIGYLDEIYSPIYFEETDYATRARNEGFEVVYCPKAEGVHLESATLDEKNDEVTYYLQKKNKIKYFLRHGDKSDLRFVLKEEIKCSIASLIGYEFNPVKELLAAYAEVMRDFPRIFSRRLENENYVKSDFMENKKDYSRRYG